MHKRCKYSIARHFVMFLLVVVYNNNIARLYEWTIPSTNIQVMNAYKASIVLLLQAL